MVNLTQRRRDGSACDECGGPNVPRGWLDSSWSTYVDDPDSQGEGFYGVVLCAPCYVARIEAKSGAQQALDTLVAIVRKHQQRVAESRSRQTRS